MTDNDDSDIHLLYYDYYIDNCYITDNTENNDDTDNTDDEGVDDENNANSNGSVMNITPPAENTVSAP